MRASRGSESSPLLGKGGGLSKEEVDAASYYHQYATTEWTGDVADPDDLPSAYPKIHPDGDPNRQSTLWTAIFHSWNATIGVGLLALPRSFASVGWATAAGALLVFSLLCLATFEMLAAAMRACNEFTFGGVMFATAGRWTAEATDFIIFLFLFGVQVVYAQVVAEISVDLLGDWDALPVDDGSWLDNRRLCVLIFGLGIFWPLCLFPRLTFLKHVSLWSTLAMCYVVVVIIIRMAEEVRPGDNESPCVLPTLNITGASCAQPVQSDASFMDYASAISTFSFALTTHTSIPPIVSELDRPTGRRVSTMLHALVWFSFGLYLLVGICGYLLFGSRQCPVVSNAFSPDDRLVQAGQIAVILSVTGGYPVQTFQARVSFDRMCRVNQWILPNGIESPIARRMVCCGLFTRSTARKMISSTILVLSSVTIAFFVSDLNAVIDLTGAVGGGVTAFVLPCIAYAAIAPRGRKIRRWLYVVLGTALVIFLTAVSSYAIAKDALGEEDVGDETCGRNV
mmetsp:Transcript_3255/g.7974  ORF Transcript_3255/g.7974 Transcript_3255/m.7974 type:complete len:510 (-) Transcript_3255:165-1694(-)|eukprot:CAMPEP_0182946008 /NCGR_PEP_ID=MMETSP0105_2-20130417/56383_1 /TAXON_ID=81532 ORGANISM="Acanthoeca-like sp., Strain 10tr" /NCGR_SAMPLE_ID=MMETSP0105_2 /ASSEMBLY_ACC=CAM_ASM_000205 /LENGTH=509 /DNA_ID=CAMNT_0025086085 /DNA_START=189 /DNA_END=1718 /DNA_ORIENTATION=+